MYTLEICLSMVIVSNPLSELYLQDTGTQTVHHFVSHRLLSRKD